MRFVEKWKKFDISLLALIFAAAFIVICAQAISRYVFNSPILWTDEVSTALQMILAFLGIGYGIRTKRHARVDSLYKTFPAKAQIVITILYNILFITVMALTIYESTRYIKLLWSIPFGTVPIGKGKVFLALPIGMGIGILYSLMDIFDHLRLLCGKEKVFNFKKEN